MRLKISSAKMAAIMSRVEEPWVNSLRPRQNGRRFVDDTFIGIFLNEHVRISIKISLKFVPKGPINNIPALVQIMAWRRPGDRPLSEPRMENLLTHICVTRSQWVKLSLANETLGFSMSWWWLHLCYVCPGGNRHKTFSNLHTESIVVRASYESYDATPLPQSNYET